MKLFMKHTGDFIDQFLIFDEKGNEKYIVSSKESKFGKKFYINSNKIIFSRIRKLYFPLVSVYFLKTENLEIALMENRMYGKPDYHINGVGWDFKNTNLPYCFSVLNKGFEVLFSQFKSFDSVYKIEIFKPEFEIECLSICVCVNNILIDDSRFSIKTYN